MRNYSLTATGWGLSHLRHGGNGSQKDPHLLLANYEGCKNVKKLIESLEKQKYLWVKILMTSDDLS